MLVTIRSRTFCLVIRCLKNIKVMLYACGWWKLSSSTQVHRLYALEIRSWMMLTGSKRVVEFSPDEFTLMHVLACLCVYANRPCFFYVCMIDWMIECACIHLHMWYCEFSWHSFRFPVILLIEYGKSFMCSSSQSSKLSDWDAAL
jgi:hypothetical protein